MNRALRLACLLGIRERILYTVSLNHAANDSSVHLLPTLFPVFPGLFQLDVFQIGIIVGVGFVINVLFQPVAGRLADRTSRHSLLMLGIGVLGVSMVLFTFATSFLSLLLVVILLRLGSSFYHPVGTSVLSRTFFHKEIDRVMGIQSSFGNMGIMSAFIVGPILYSFFGWQAPFYTWVMINVAVVVITFFNRHGFDQNSSKVGPEVASSSVEIFREHRSSLFMIAVAGSAYALISNFGNLLAVTRGFTLVGADFLIAAWLGTATVGSILFGRISHHWGRRRSLSVAFALLGGTILAIITSSNEIVLIGALLANGFMLSLTYPGIYAEVSDQLKIESSGKVFGLLYSFQILGSAIFSFTSGYLSSLFGLEAPFVVLAGLALATLVVLEVLPRAIRLFAS